MKPISSMLTSDLNSINVNSSKEDINNVNSITVADKVEKFFEEEDIRPEGVAQMLSEGLSDEKSYAYYLILAKENSASVLLQVLHLTKEAQSLNLIRKNKAVYFMGILKKRGIKTKFKKS